MSKFEILFLPNNKRITTSEKITLLEAAKRAGIPLYSECGGKGTCGKCKVKVLDNNFPVSSYDRDFFNPDEIKEGWRLACKTSVNQNIHIEIPSLESLKNMRILLRGKRKKLKLLPGVKKNMPN